MPQSYMAIFERHGEELLLYVSSNCRQAIGYTPEEMVGTSILNYSADTFAKHYSCRWPYDNPEIGVTMLPHNLRHRDGRSIFAHVLCINCTGHIFSLITTYEELGTVHIGESVLYKLQHDANFDTDDNRSALSIANNTASSSSSSRTRPNSANSSINSSTSSTYNNSHEDMVNLDYPKVTRASLRNASMHTTRACRDKACFVLDRSDRQLEGSVGPRVVFVTNTVSRIFDDNVDGDELINMPFFSIVATAEITKIARFMDTMLSTSKPQICRVNFLRNPVSDQSGGRDVVQVELLGAISDDGAMLMCQKVRKKGSVSSGDTELGYLSLEEIISSDPDSSDIPEEWKEFVV
ncbi:hypothetical protein GGI12_001209 [Dipsacomyces acuminosporus]|nr:hypothetical protein GGI12_001209 [Dipsacomyces acuminosporus]